MLGNVITAFSIVAFQLPNHFLTGGATGVSRVIHNYTGIPISWGVAGVSVLLFLLGLFVLGKGYAATIVLGTFFFPVVLDLWGRVPNITMLGEEPVLSVIYAGLTMGVGIGLILWAGGSSGGSDVLAIILHKKTNLRLGMALYVVDILILLLQIPFASVNGVLYGILNILLYTFMINKVTMIGRHNTQFLIISREYERINRALQDEVDCGSTLIHATTGRLGEETNIIMCTVDNKEIRAVKNAIMEIDPEAFVTMTETSEVSGRGFTLDRRALRANNTMK